MGIIRIQTYTIEDVLPHIVECEGVYRYYGEYKMRMNSVRLLTFKEKGIACAVCGINGQFMAQEYSTGSKLIIPHFNMYAIQENGQEIMMTVDHIVPKALGGGRTTNNLETMCIRCNSKKAAGPATPYFKVRSIWRGHKGQCKLCKANTPCDHGKELFVKFEITYEQYKEYGVPAPEY